MWVVPVSVRRRRQRRYCGGLGGGLSPSLMTSIHDSTFTGVQYMWKQGYYHPSSLLRPSAEMQQQWWRAFLSLSRPPEAVTSFFFGAWQCHEASAGEGLCLLADALEIIMNPFKCTFDTLPTYYSLASLLRPLKNEVMMTLMFVKCSSLFYIGALIGPKCPPMMLFIHRISKNGSLLMRAIATCPAKKPIPWRQRRAWPQPRRGR